MYDPVFLTTFIVFTVVKNQSHFIVMRIYCFVNFALENKMQTVIQDG